MSVFPTNDSKDANSKWVFTTDEGRRGGKTLHLKKIVDKAVNGVDCVEKVFMFTATGAEVCSGRPQAFPCWMSCVHLCLKQTVETKGDVGCLSVLLSKFCPAVLCRVNH